MKTIAFILSGMVALAAQPAAAQIYSSAGASVRAGSLCCVVGGGTEVRDGTPQGGRQTTGSASVGYIGKANGISHDVTAAASSYANLTTGKVGLAMTSSNYGFAAASAGWNERLRFTIAGATNDTVTPIEFTFNYHGTFEPLYGFTSIDFIFNANQTLGSGSYGGTGGFGINRSAGRFAERSTDTLSNSGWLSYQATPDGSGDNYFIKAIFGLKGANPILDLSTYLSGYQTHDAFADFSNTATFAMSVPDTVRFTSNSGVFLSNVAAVPEPASWAMLLVGFGLVGGMIRAGRASPGTRHRVRVAGL